MAIVTLTVLERDGMWCVQIDDRRRVFHLGASQNKESVLAYAERLAALILAGGDAPVLRQGEHEQRHAA